MTLASQLLYARQFGEAKRVARQVVDFDPGFGPGHFFLAQVLTATGDHAAAVTHAESAVQASRRSGEALAVLACAQAAAGATDAAERLHRELEERSRERYTSPAHRAVVAAALGRVDAALDLLDAAVEEHAPDLLWLGVRPAWDTLRMHPRFGALIRRLNLEPG